MGLAQPLHKVACLQRGSLGGPCTRLQLLLSFLHELLHLAHVAAQALYRQLLHPAVLSDEMPR